MSLRVRIWGYDQDFKSKTAAIIFLLNEGKLKPKQIIQKLNCTHQHINAAKLKMGKNEKA
jgi:hypothetical protein